MSILAAPTTTTVSRYTNRPIRVLQDITRFRDCPLRFFRRLPLHFRQVFKNFAHINPLYFASSSLTVAKRPPVIVFVTSPHSSLYVVILTVPTLMNYSQIVHNSVIFRLRRLGELLKCCRPIISRPSQIQRSSPRLGKTDIK